MGLAKVMSIGSLAAKVNPAESQMTKSDPTGGLVGLDWPPQEHRERITAYEDNRDIWEGDHQVLAVRSNQTVLGYEYITVNIGKVIVTIPADLLFGEELQLQFPDEATDKQRDRVQEIWERNDLQTLLYENALDTGYSGDGVWTVGRAVDGDEGKAVIKTHAADIWFPESDPDNIRDILRHRLAWVKRWRVRGESTKEYLRVVTHERGHVTHELYRLKKGRIDSPADDPEWEYFYDAKPEPVQEGIEGEFLLVHVPNFRTAREYFGRSEYTGLESLFASVNGRMTQVDGILDRHSNPKMGLTAEQWRAATEGGKREPDLENFQAFAIGDNGEIPQYLTWDGKLADNLACIDAAIQQIAVISETAPQLLQRADWGGNLSGRALKILLLRTLTKVDRKRRYYNTAIPKILELAQRIEGETDPIRVGLDWPDGLPADVMEQLEEVRARLETGTMSRKGAIKFLDGVDDEKAESILSEIGEEDETEADIVGRGMEQRQVPRINVNLAGETEE